MPIRLIFAILEGIHEWNNRISTGPLSKKEIRRIIKEISILIEEGEKLIQEDQYFDARKLFIGAFQLDRILPSSSSVSIDIIKGKIEFTETIINEKELDQISLILDNGDNFKNTQKYEEAVSEYEKAYSFIDKMHIYDTDSRNGLKKTVFLRQIDTLLEEGDKLKSKGLIDNAIMSFKNALNFALKMYSSKEKQQVISKIEENLDIYTDTIQEKIKAGKILMEQNNFEDSMNNFQVAKELINKKYELLENSIPNRVKNVNEIRDIDSLLEQCNLKRSRIDENDIPSN
jgi:tetratricopeptide (TPR) repeat protein